MKLRDLIAHLNKHGAEWLREGGNHSVYVHRGNRKSTAVPRHREINDFLCRKICKDLDIPPPGKT